MNKPVKCYFNNIISLNYNFTFEHVYYKTHCKAEVFKLLKFK